MCTQMHLKGTISFSWQKPNQTTKKFLCMIFVVVILVINCLAAAVCFVGFIFIYFIIYLVYLGNCR